jgi:hypothetical protein
LDARAQAFKNARRTKELAKIEVGRNVAVPAMPVSTSDTVTVHPAPFGGLLLYCANFTRAFLSLAHAAQVLQGHDPYGTYVREAEARIAVREAPMVLRVELWLTGRHKVRYDDDRDAASSFGGSTFSRATTATVRFMDAQPVLPGAPGTSEEVPLVVVTVPSGAVSAQAVASPVEPPDPTAPSSSQPHPGSRAAVTLTCPPHLSLSVGVNPCASIPTNPPTVSWPYSSAPFPR